MLINLYSYFLGIISGLILFLIFQIIKMEFEMYIEDLIKFKGGKQK
jgi:hypothetical protein